VLVFLKGRPLGDKLEFEAILSYQHVGNDNTSNTDAVARLVIAGLVYTVIIGDTFARYRTGTTDGFTFA